MRVLTPRSRGRGNGDGSSGGGAGERASGGPTSGASGGAVSVGRVLTRERAPVARTAGAVAAPPLEAAKPRHCVTHKLLSPSFELAVEELQQQLTDGSDFTVIGVLGPQGVGKSTIMSLLAGASCGDEGVLDPPFPPQTVEVLLGAAHQTSGVDLMVTSERLLLLDTQPVWSPSVLLEMQRQQPPLPPEAQTYENLLELSSLRQSMLLLSVCHQVIFVHDTLFDTPWLRNICAAQMLCHRLPDLSTLASSTPPPAASSSMEEVAPVVEYRARCSFVFNRLSPAAFSQPDRERLGAMLTRLLHRGPVKPSKNLAADSVLGGSRGATKQAEGRPSERRVQESQEEDDEPLVFLLPDSYEGRGLCNAHNGFQFEAEQMRDGILAARRRPFARPLSEKEWLRGVGKLWSLIVRSTTVSEYNRTMQKMHIFA